MVEAVNAGAPVRAVARQFGVSRPTVARWVARATGKHLDRVDWTDRASIPHGIHRMPPAIEAQVLALRRDLHATSALGEYSAVYLVLPPTRSKVRTAVMNGRSWLARPGAESIFGSQR